MTVHVHASIACDFHYTHKYAELVNHVCWWSGIEVSTLASINEVNLRQAQLVLRWATVSQFNSQCRTFISVCNQPATPGQLSLPSLWGG